MLRTASVQRSFSSGGGSQKISLLGKWNVDSNTGVFTATLAVQKLIAARKSLRDRRLAIVCRVQDDTINPEDDTAIVMSDLRVPSTVNHVDLPLQANCSGLLVTSPHDAVIQAYVLSIPADVDVSTCQTIRQLLAAGCDIVDGCGKAVSSRRRRDSR
jgi:hypothetical protein